MSKSMHAEQGEPSTHNHHLQQFLAFLKQERGFADATIVSRQRSLRPFLAWLGAQDVPLSSVSPAVITNYFTGGVAGRRKRTTISFHVQSLRSFFALPAVEGGAPRASPSPSKHPGCTLTKTCHKARRGER